MVTVRYIKPTHNKILVHQIDPVLWSTFSALDIQKFQKRLNELRKTSNVIAGVDIHNKNILHYILESTNEKHFAFAEVLVKFMSQFPVYSGIHFLSRAYTLQKNNCLHFIAFSGDIRKLNIYKNYLINTFTRGMTIIRKMAACKNSHDQFPTSNNDLLNQALIELRTPNNSPTANAASPVSPVLNDVKNSDVKEIPFKPICYLGVDKNFFPIFPCGFFFSLSQEDNNQLFLDQEHFDDATMLEEYEKYSKNSP